MRGLLLCVTSVLMSCMAAPWSFAQTGTPSAQAIAIARSVGLPAVDPSGRVAGPFEGSQSTLYYLGSGQLITFYQPYQYVAYFGTLTPAGIVFQYGLTLQGQFVFDQWGQPRQVQVLPNDVYRYPHANAVAQVLIRYLTAVAHGQIAAPSGYLDYRSLSQTSRSLHSLNMSILDNMGSAGCTDHYEDVYYLGCW